MLKEIKGVADDPPARRRWFHDDYFDLFVWQAEGVLTLFQLCYGPDSSDRALVWDRDRGFFHDGPPGGKDWVDRFDGAATALPEDIRDEVVVKVQEFARERPRIATRRSRFRRQNWQQR